MIAGGVLGMTGFALPLIEPAIAASLLVLGLMIATMTELPLTAGIGLIAVFGLFHGNAHGLEAPLNGSGLLYGLGFTLSTISLHIAGLSLGFATRGRAQILLRAGAALIAVTGGVLFFT
jgi:urease accessory protein